ncbi:Chk1 protein kinase [Tilletia horrida]|nr:Chk1 protein kinase [Tilletia horrida]
MPVPTSSSGLIYAKPLGYELVQQIGGGGFSKVFRALKITDDRHPIAAVKVVSFAPPPPPPATTQFDEKGNPVRVQPPAPRHPVDRRALQKEVQIHSVLKHEAVLEFIGAEEHGGKAKSVPSNTVPGLYIVLELAAGGDLFDKIAPDFGLEEDLAHFYFRQLIGGLEYIHNQGVVHRDIKPENLLLDAEGNVKLADFGLCSVYKYKGKEREMHGACGSLPYIAPEMNGRPYRGEPVDVWSAGVVLFALLVGNTPWDEPTQRSPEYEAYLTGELFKYDPWTRLQPDTLSLVRKMLEPEPSKRLRIDQVQQHRWFKRQNRFMSAANRCTDPSLLAERLLHGLMVSGDMHANLRSELHSDGKRAEVPDVISHTQPAEHFTAPITFGPSFPAAPGAAVSTSDWFNSAAVQPPSASQASTARVTLRGPTGGLKSLSVSDAEAQLARLKREGPTQGGPRWGNAGPTEDVGMSQFTQTFNLLTQWSPSMIMSSALRFSPELTRFFTSREPADVVRHLVQILQGQHREGSSLVSGPATSTEGNASFSLRGIQISLEGCVVQSASAQGRGSNFTRTNTEDLQDLDGDSQMLNTLDGGADLPPSSSRTLVDAPGADAAAQAATESGSAFTRSNSIETVRPSVARSHSASSGIGPSGDELRYIVSPSGARIRLSTMDRRKCPLRGEILVAPFRAVRAQQPAEEDTQEQSEDGEGTRLPEKDQEEAEEEAPRCVVIWKRSKGNPLEWRKLFRAVTADSELQHMLVRV